MLSIRIFNLNLNLNLDLDLDLNLNLFLSLALLNLLLLSTSYSQVENVPIDDPVYTFLRRMDAKGILPKYHDTFLTLPRIEVSKYLDILNEHRNRLTTTEKELLDMYRAEFSLDYGLDKAPRTILLDDSTTITKRIGDLFSSKEKFIYAYRDSSVSFYGNFIFSLNMTSANGTSHAPTSYEMGIFGGRVHGTIGSSFGYYLQVTNGLLYGDKTYALGMDPQLQANYKIHEANSNSFDETEGYLQYHNNWLTVQVGREQLLWGTAVDPEEKLYLSSDAAPFDFIRMNAQYGIFSFAYIHGWLQGMRTFVYNAYADMYDESVEPKYIAAHEINLSFPGVLDFGANEMIIYSRPSPELAYLNPVNFFKSVEHSLQDRDNALLTFDVKTHFLDPVQIFGSILIDDMDFSKLGTKYWGNLFAYQIGGYYIEPFKIPDADLLIQYTLIDPYVFSHHIPVNSYTNKELTLGYPMEPNSDRWVTHAGYWLSRDVYIQGGYIRERHGANIVDSNGILITNVGGDILFGHRAGDGIEKEFLGGIRTIADRFQAKLVYQIVRNIFCELQFEYRLQSIFDPVDNSTTKTTDRTFYFQFRFLL